jgi:hypothetical protein
MFSLRMITSPVRSSSSISTTGVQSSGLSGTAAASGRPTRDRSRRPAIARASRLIWTTRWPASTMMMPSGADSKPA